MNRKTWDGMINDADRLYVHHLAWSSPTLQKNPAKIVRRLVSLFPQDTVYDVVYQEFSYACHKSTTFTEQIDGLFLKYIEPVDTDWKREMVGIWNEWKK